MKAVTGGLMSPSRTVREVWPGPILSVIIRLGPRLLTLREGPEDVGQKPEIELLDIIVPGSAPVVKYLTDPELRRSDQY